MNRHACHRPLGYLACKRAESMDQKFLTLIRLNTFKNILSLLVSFMQCICTVASFAGSILACIWMCVCTPVS